VTLCRLDTAIAAASGKHNRLFPSTSLSWLFA
jgi:hypothetical protein